MFFYVFGMFLICFAMFFYVLGIFLICCAMLFFVCSLFCYVLLCFVMLWYAFAMFCYVLQRFATFCYFLLRFAMSERRCLFSHLVHLIDGPVHGRRSKPDVVVDSWHMVRRGPFRAF